MVLYSPKNLMSLGPWAASKMLTQNIVTVVWGANGSLKID